MMKSLYVKKAYTSHSVTTSVTDNELALIRAIIATSHDDNLWLEGDNIVVYTYESVLAVVSMLAACGKTTSLHDYGNDMQVVAISE